MFGHVFIGTNDVDASRKFYDATMGVLGHHGFPLPHGSGYAGDGGVRNRRLTLRDHDAQFEDGAQARIVEAGEDPARMVGL